MNATSTQQVGAVAAHRIRQLSNENRELHAAVLERDATIQRQLEENVSLASRVEMLETKLQLYDENDSVFAEAVARLWQLAGLEGDADA